MTPPLRIGAGAGFADDRIEPAIAMAEAAAVSWDGGAVGFPGE